MFAFTGDRFIVRDWSEQATLAGGIVLDADPAPENLKNPVRLQFLSACVEKADDLCALLLSEISRFGAAQENKLLVKSRFSEGEVVTTLTSLEQAGKILRSRGWAIDYAFWNHLQRKAADRIDAEHLAHPNRPGLSLVDLKRSILPELPSDDLWPVFVNATGPAFIVSANLIRRSDHRLALPSRLEAAGAKARAALSAKQFDPPSRKEIAPDPTTQEALRFLLETGEAILLSEEIVMLADATNHAAEIVRSFLRKQNAASASELRQALGTSRRVIIPLLEHFDREGITRRQGDSRVLA